MEEDMIDDISNFLVDDENKDINNIPIDDMTELESPISFDLDNIDEEAREAATLLTERLSGYYFDPKYLQSHPYIPLKIAAAMDNVRRLMKALSINEKALDILIANICKTPNKANIFMSLTSMQNGMLNVSKALNDLIENLENIFRKMQDECDKTFQDKAKEEADDGTMMTKGSREFIKELQAKLWQKSSDKLKEESKESSTEEQLIELKKIE